jgi:hypothetical protein
VIGRGGFGLITSSNFFVPQVNRHSSMARFVAPAAIPRQVVVANANAKRGLGSARSGYWRPNRGLGVAPPECLSGQSIWCGPGTDCSSPLQYYLTSSCWGVPLENWQLLAKPLPAPSVPPPPTADQLAAVQTGADAEALTQALSNQAVVQTQANVQSYFGPPTAPPPPDCTDPWTLLTDPTCGILGLPYVAWAAAGLLAIMLFKK